MISGLLPVESETKGFTQEQTLQTKITQALVKCVIWQSQFKKYHNFKKILKQVSP